MTPPAKGSKQDATFAARLLDWYDWHHRELPWRVTPAQHKEGVRADPYRVWLSEIMLQQTTVEAVKAYFAKFTEIWPTVEALAAADASDVMKAWAGLGYYSRARNLKKCADLIVAELGGQFPDAEADLRDLPGVGAYTAAAIAAIVFDRTAAVMDGNVERVIGRYFAVTTPLPAAKPDMRAVLVPLVPQRRPGDFAQAMMDLGATVCTPKRPSCMTCPLRDGCAALTGGDPELYPIKAAKAQRPVRRGAAFVALRGDGAVLLERRPERGLLGGMSGLPTTGWTARQDGATGVHAAPFAADWRLSGAISHVFTHFELRLDVFLAEVANVDDLAHGMFWSRAEELPGEALPTLFKKVIEAAIPGALKRR